LQNNSTLITNKLTVYFISGQAADEKIFENLSLPSNITIRHVHWIEPLPKEDMLHYCNRLSEQIDTSDTIVLVGVSFGGIVSIELNKIIHPKEVIIISSIATKHELRPIFKLVKLLKLQKIVPPQIYKLYSPILNWYFGATTPREKELMRLYVKSATKNFMKWATNEILNWKNETRPSNFFHIHGTRDRIFPHRRTNADIKIKNGSHLMIHNHSEEISKLLSDKINAIPL